MLSAITKNAIESFVERFRDRDIPEKEWTHEAHLITALYYLKNYTKDEATCWLRGGIIAYNASLGNQNTPSSGYHETLTLFWIEIINQFIQQHPNLELPDLSRAFLASPYASSSLPLQYYGRERLFSTSARARWVEPDLQELYKK